MRQEPTCTCPMPVMMAGPTLWKYIEVAGPVIKAKAAMVGWLSLSLGWEKMVLNGDLRLFHLILLTSCNLSKQCRPWSHATFWSGSALSRFITLFTQHSDVTAIRIAWLSITITWILFKCYLYGLTLLVRDSTVDNSNITQDSLVTLGRLKNNQPKIVQFGNRIRFRDNRLWFHIVNNWLVRLTGSLTLLVNDNHMDNNLKEI